MAIKNKGVKSLAVAGFLITAFSIAAAYQMSQKVDMLEAQLTAYEDAEGIVKLNGLAAEHAAAARDYCGPSLFSNYTPTASLIERFGHIHNRSDIPLERSIGVFERLQEEGVTVLSGTSADAVVQFFDDPDQGKFLFIDDLILAQDGEERTIAFIEELAQNGFSLGDGSRAMTKVLIHTREEGFFEVEGPAGQDEVIREVGEYRLPVKVLSGPSCR